MSGECFGFFRHLRRTFELVPIERFAVDRALQGLEEHDGEDLAVAEALNPYVDQQPRVAAAGRVFALECEGQRRREKVDDEEGGEEGEQFVEAVGRGRFGVEVLVDEVVQYARHKHQVDQRRDQRKQYLEDEDVGQCKQAHGSMLPDGPAMLEDGL